MNSIADFLQPQRQPVRARRPLHLLPAPGCHRVLTMPDAGVAPILAALQGARRRICVKMFKLTSETVQDALIAAATRGVEVRVMLNPSRSDGSRANDEAAERLRAGGVSVAWTNPAFYVTHEKSMVVDDEATICTFNFADKYFQKTRGYAVVTSKPQEVREVLEGFEADWERRPFRPGALVWSQAGAGNSRACLRELIGSARYQLDIQNPKLVDQDALECLLAALRRGVRVRFLSSGQKGISDYDVAENSSAQRLLRERGAEVRQVKKPRIHAKLLLADERRALVGSLNLDRSCFELRRELAIVVDEPAALAPLAQTFASDWSRSEPFCP